jgi:hypothetical protein
MTFFGNSRQPDEGGPSSEERHSGKSTASPCLRGRSARPAPRRPWHWRYLQNKAHPVINHGIKSGIRRTGWEPQISGYESTRSGMSRFSGHGYRECLVAFGGRADLPKDKRWPQVKAASSHNSAALGRMAPILPHSSAFLCLGDVGLGPPIV